MLESGHNMNSPTQTRGLRREGRRSLCVPVRMGRVLEKTYIASGSTVASVKLKVVGILLVNLLLTAL